MTRKNLVILYNKDDWGAKRPLDQSPETRLSFEDFYTFAGEKGWNVFRASIQWFDMEKMAFKKAWTFSHGSWSKVTTLIAPDALFDKIAGKYDYSLFETKLQMSSEVPLKNSPFFRTFFDNKFSQFLAFSEYMPRTTIAENKQQFLRLLRGAGAQKKVIKEVYGSGGKQVFIGIGNDLIKMAGTLNYPIILQDFIETAGVPGVSAKDSVADLRLVYIDNELIYALSRIAKPGSLYTNFHQGAQAELVPIEKIPATCTERAERIKGKLSQFEKTNYSLDFMFSKSGAPLFIEMNTTPGFDLLRLVGSQEIKERYYSKMLDSFCL